MLNVDELESKYKKYKLKSYTPYLAISLGVSAAILSISFFVLYDFNSKTEIKEELTVQNYQENAKPEEVLKKDDETFKQEPSEIITTEEKAEEKAEEEKKEEENEKPIVEDRDEKIQLAPSLNFIKRLESEAPVYKKDTSPNTVAVVEEKTKKPIEKSSQNVKHEDKKEEVVLPVVEEVKESIAVVEKPIIEKPTQSTSTIDIKRRDDEEDIKHVIKRFNVNHNPALSLFVAKKYYQLGDYEQAYNYSLITNDINNNIEASWIVFSKSLVKLGKKEKAVETLKKYISHSDSSQARQLLDEILSGKFK